MNIDRLKDPIALLSDQSWYVSNAAQSMLEWCNEKITKHFDVGRTNPFQYTNVNLIHSMKEFDKMAPKVVLATSSSMECGFSRELLIKWGGDDKNCIIFPFLPTKDSLAGQILANEKNREHVHQVLLYPVLLNSMNTNDVCIVFHDRKCDFNRSRAISARS